jgi:hypothetical protein
MLIVHGIYRFRPKRLAFRNDFCRTCQVPRRAEQWRTFDAWHIFWIPLIPLGFWKRWLCAGCGKQPHIATGTRRPFKWIGFAILILFSPLFWFMPPDPEFPVAVLWLLRIASPVGAVLLLAHLLRTAKDPTFKEQLAGVPPANDTVCPFCGTQLLMMASQTSCPRCYVVRL